MLAARAALRLPEQHDPGAGIDGWPPASIRDLRPFDAIVGTPGIAQSILVRFVDSTTGKPGAVAKVKTSRAPVAEYLVRTEHEALKDPALDDLVPHQLETGDAAGHHYLLTRFVDGKPAPPGRRGLEKALQALVYQNKPTRAVPIQDHPWVQRAVRRMPWLKLKRLQGSSPIVRTHGDFAPWNILSEFKLDIS